MAKVLIALLLLTSSARADYVHPNPTKASEETKQKLRDHGGDARGMPAVDTGCANGLPVKFNPDCKLPKIDQGDK